MFLTLDTLIKLQACAAGQKWFARYFPNGAELIEVINHPKIDKETLHWGYSNLSTNEEEKAAYLKKLNINCDNTSSIYLSDNIEDCEFVANSSNIDHSEYVFNCEEVKDSSNIANSTTVERSEGIFNSEFVYDCKHVCNGKNINHSSNIVNSHYVVNSKHILNCSSIVNSQFITDLFIGSTERIKNSTFITSCHDLDHCLFCTNVSHVEYLLFNKPVSKEEYEMIWVQLNSILINSGLNLVNPDWPEKEIPLDAPKVNRNIKTQFSTLPDKFWRWVKTLPGYDPMIMYGITMQENLLS